MPGKKQEHENMWIQEVQKMADKETEQIKKLNQNRAQQR